MNPLWFLEATFYMKLYFVCMIAGVTFFMYYILELLQGWNTKLRKCVQFVKRELALEKKRRNEWVSELRKRFVEK